ncbi:MAG: LamG-like jellyroll fold domain-containing protein [Spirochaetaceae bacterium]
MTGKQTAITVVIVLLASTLVAQERVVRVGGGDGWEELLVRTGVELRSGRRGNEEVRLAGAAYRPDGETDVLLPFDEPGNRDASGNYRLENPARTTDRLARRGAGSGVFSPDAAHLKLRPAGETLFTPGRVWGDFTIEFWLYPTRTAEGETVLLWEGGRRRGSTDILAQEIRAAISNRRLQWRFRNVFLPTDQSPFEISLESRTDLVPRTWQHHMLRYDSSTGMLEYLRDGRAEDITHATSSKTERGAVYFPYIGEASEGLVEVGRGLVGFLDELRISSAFREPPEPGSYPGSGGTAVTRPLDLGSTGARIERLDAEFLAPGTTAVHFYYRSAGSRSALETADLDAGWIPFEPGRELEPAVQGRFVQVRAELYPGGERNRTPRLVDIRVVYEPDRPPSPPARVIAIPGDGEVTLRWDGVPDADVRGYTVFYGTRTGRYFGTEASIGDSPAMIDDRTEVTIDGLDNGTLYFFAVASRDASSTTGESVLSSEVTARPSRLGR